ncbi:PAS domain S-box-containing protein [Granulicella rosea]|uniref:PAS domain S-box-containing protein n=1 Tax=Granulicella rosea TaxID=474952 RepID=A0A239LIU1_9BACT|nr:EAL domain-containing protein [Granulicella rosea]SNT30506.1 PAS domain S-box-containing protein [Granulicella rosea]
MSIDREDLRVALELDQLVPHFQPIVSVSSGEICGFEILARWRHSSAGNIRPDVFIRIAEESGQIDLLTQRILRKALRAAPKLPAPLFLTVNLSTIQLQNMELATEFETLLTNSGFPAERLTLEITETALIVDMKRTSATIHALKSLGCRLALDDFGVGCSNLEQLQSLPFDMLKIDRSFVDSIVKSRKSRKIAASIVGLARSLGLTTVAEGIETESQADMLLWLGCQLGQGWWYGRAEAEDQITPFLNAPRHPAASAMPRPGDNWAVSSLEALPAQRLSQLQAIYAGSPVALAFLDRNLRYVSLNERYAAITGRTVQAHLGQTVEEMAPEVYPEYESYCERALGGESIHEVEINWPLSEIGHKIQTGLVSLQPAFDEANEVIGISVVVMDVARLKRRLDGMLVRDNPQRDLEDLAAKKAWTMDEVGDRVPSRANTRSSGWLSAVLPGALRIENLGWLEALHVDDLEPTMKAVKEAMLTGRPIDVEYRVSDLIGGWKWVRSRGSARHGEDGEIIRWYGSVQEIDRASRSPSPV